jgi:hypothetical protein
MGIHLLNSFLRSLYDNGSKIIHLNKLSGKKIVIDTSIYLYRFKSMNGLLENIYLMCSIFRYYNIHPLFVFDGQADKNKYKTIEKRKEEKKKAKDEYYKIKKIINSASEDEKELLEDRMNKLRRRFIKITREDVDNVKNLLKFYGITYIESPGESDELCAALVIKGHAYACLSEDTDMFAFGCPRVLKYFSLMNHTAVVYYIENILNKLNIKFGDFQKLCILSGTDYNFTNKNIFWFYNLFKKYKNIDFNGEFTEWLEYKNHITIQTYYELKDIYTIYNKNPSEILNKISYLIIKNKKINENGIKSVLQKEHFIFAH